MRILLLCLLCLLGWSGQVLPQRSLSDIEEAYFRLTEQIGNGSIAYETALDSLECYATISQDSLPSGWQNIHLNAQLSRIIVYQLNGDFDAADRLLQSCFLNNFMDPEFKFRVIDALIQQTIENAQRLFHKSDYERGRKLLELYRPYLPLSLLPQWQKTYASSYLLEHFTVPFGDHQSSVLLLKKSHLLAQEWGIPDLEVQSIGLLGVVFADYLENDSAYFYLQEADRLGQLYNLPQLRFQFLDEFSKLAWDYGDIVQYERINAITDSLMNFVQDGPLMYRYYLNHILRYERQGKWKQVEMWLHKAEKWFESTDDPNKFYHRRSIYCRTALLYNKIGDLDSALSYGHKALQAWQQDSLHIDWSITDMREHPFAILGSIYKTLGDSVHQFAYMDSLVTYANQMNNSSLLLYKSFLLRGKAFYDSYDFDRALKDYEKCLYIIDKNFPDLTEERAKVLVEIATTKVNNGEFQDGLEVLKEAYGIILARYGDIPYVYWPIWRYLAETYLLMGDPVSGCTYWEDYLRAVRSYIQTNFINRDPKEALGQFSTIFDDFQRYTGFIVDAGLLFTPHVLGAYDSYLLTSLCAFDMYRSGLSRIKLEGNENHVRDYLHLQRLEALLDEELEKNFADRGSYEQLNEQADSLRSVLRLESKAYGDLTRRATLDFKQIKAQLKQDEFLINAMFMDDVNGDFTYCVFLVHPDFSYPIALSLPVPDGLLPTQPDIESGIYEFPLAGEFIETVWEPISGYIPAGSTVYYCTNEAFAPIALENIPIGKDSILGERYTFKRISSPLSLIESTDDLLTRESEPAQAVLYGGLRYDMTAEEKAVAELTYHEDPLLSVALNASRGDTCFQYLPGTYEEVTAINKLLTKSQVPTFVHTGAEGTEQSFLTMSGHAPNILHLATHGYYTGASSFQRFDVNRNIPGLWSGLVLSGGNDEWRDTTTVYGTRGGLITSYEIAQLDFSNVDLLVLSACHTAKSVIALSGDIGLVGAFKTAGVKTVVMTLWEVSDQVTQDFMVKFYQELIDRKWNKLSAFEAAKAYIRNRYPESYYWAGFVIVDAQ